MQTTSAFYPCQNLSILLCHNINLADTKAFIPLGDKNKHFAPMAQKQWGVELRGERERERGGGERET